MQRLQKPLGESHLRHRMKDFYDMQSLIRGFSFDGSILADAIKNTFAALSKHRCNPYVGKSLVF